MAAPNTFGELNLSIVGLGVQYPPHSLDAKALETLGQRFYPESPSMKRVLGINRYTGIDARASIGTPDHPLVNQAQAPSIAELHQTFMSDGVPLAVRAARKALDEAGLTPADVTHVVATTCTDSANPGFDHFVARELGIGAGAERVLLHGVGCSGGLAALRTAANLALGHTARGRSARVLCVALEVCTTLVRSELDSVDALQQTRIGACLFSDCGSAAVLSNGLGDEAASSPEESAQQPIYELLGWDFRILPDTENDLAFDVDPAGWKVVLTPRVPSLTGASLVPAFTDLLASLPSVAPGSRQPADFDWAMHPGGATILTGAERALGITPEHMRASYDTYIRHGNSSSATIFSVMDRLRHPEMDALAPAGRASEHVVGCAFGPGVTVEMCMLRRPGAPAATSTGAGTETEPSEVDSADGASLSSSSDEEVFRDAGADAGYHEFVAAELERLELD